MSADYKYLLVFITGVGLSYHLDLVIICIFLKRYCKKKVFFPLEILFCNWKFYRIQIQHLEMKSVQGCHIIFTLKFPDFSRFSLTFLINFLWPTRCNSQIAFIKEMVNWQNKHLSSLTFPWLSRPFLRVPDFSRYSLTCDNFVKLNE